MSQQQESFPRQSARTRHFRLGAPRTLSVAADGSRIIATRSGSGDDPVNQLIVIDSVADELHERVVVDPLALLDGGAEHLSPAERARRERMRESTSGVTTYSCDAASTSAAFALSGQLYVVDLVSPTAVPQGLPATSPVVDPRLSPDGRWVSYVADRALHLIDVTTGADRVLCQPDSDTVSWGLADFIASEELDRFRGHWWAPDSSALLVERYDEALVAEWWISDPASPGSEPAPHRYPAAGTANAEVELHLVSLDGTVREVTWNQAQFPYVTSVSWTSFGPPLITVMSRDQRHEQVLSVDPDSADVTVLRERTDDCWLDVVAGLPTWTADGRLATSAVDRNTDTFRLSFDDVYVTPPGAQLMGVLGSDDQGLLVVLAADPAERVPTRVALDGSLTPLTSPAAVATVAVGGDVCVIVSTSLGTVETQRRVTRKGEDIGELASFAETPSVLPRVQLLSAGERGVPTAVLFPTDHVAVSQRLPVIMSPYGGPHHAEVLATGLAFAQDQWIADQGFVVIVADGRGTPGRGPAWERAIFRNFVDPVLDDQIAALTAVATAFPDDIDTTRVGITGWSFGGWLAALAVLERPDVFHAAVAGAPVTDWRLYDTAYTERYLGHPDTDPDAYEHNSLIPRAARLRRPLLLIHGLADDNVVAAHTLALSDALLVAGRPHSVLPLTGVTHMAAQPEVAENLLRLQVEFLRDNLDRAGR